jgi:uncharacterized protein
MKRITWIVLGELVLLTMAQAASFDCGKVKSNIEKLICGDAALSKLDEELSASYKIALEDERQVDSFRQTQKQWLKERNGCSDAACVKLAYETRLKSLTVLLARSSDVGEPTNLKVTSSTQGGDWTYRDGGGKNQPLCHELLKRLNRYDRDESLENRCSFPVIASYPQFTMPPWEELDLKTHEELLFKLMKYSGEGGPDGYFHLLPGLKQRAPDSTYRYKAKQFAKEGVHLRMWRTRLVQHYGTGPIVSAPPGEQAIVQMYIPMPKEGLDTYCVGKPKPAKVNSLELLFIVTADLSGPDPNVDPGTFGILGGRDLVIYEGQPWLVSSEDIWRDGVLMLNQYCDFEFVKWKK